MNMCRTCEYWTQHSIGDCSQKMQTQSGEFVNVRTVGDYGCNSYESDFKKFNIAARIDDKDIIRIGGIMDASFLKKVIEKLEEKIKELR